MCWPTFWLGFLWEQTHLQPNIETAHYNGPKMCSLCFNITNHAVPWSVEVYTHFRPFLFQKHRYLVTTLFKKNGNHLNLICRQPILAPTSYSVLELADTLASKALFAPGTWSQNNVYTQIGNQKWHTLFPPLRIYKKINKYTRSKKYRCYLHPLDPPFFI